MYGCCSWRVDLIWQKTDAKSKADSGESSAALTMSSHFPVLVIISTIDAVYFDRCTAISFIS
ncbi:hypothetical protein POSPLADRAFT_1039111 [Postia placenta MAD-698-R-SB12]|uniref:Uncharacterized protein n=1 Tax=Postia placenta MAD-698-R-SB12 TaxID=670580 RepID=A0A1X6NAF9_9APHY|nr:hypothetical protein POSPLADRAFT_1039111 [Postia placenta MAD-698-R-SB12]OSX65492.1 hypothetical protein POSPLADRAFT_1039111 [Postia placenta MAD-698-R-SB12]